MHVQALELSQYRNYRKLNVELDPNLNIFVGDNAQGKTNLIESIYLLATGRSHRTFRDTELIKWNAEDAQIKAQVNTRMGSFSMRVILARNRRKRFWIGGEELRRQSELLGFLNVVLFSPDDLQLVKGSPGMRRHFIDLGLAQVSRVYRHDLVNYNRVLQQRNSLLKDIAERKAKVDQLHLWDEQLVQYGSRIMYRRARAIERIADFAGASHRDISGGEEILTVHYRPFYLGDEESIDATRWLDAEQIAGDFAKMLQSSRSQELRRGTTLVGPQRDDILFRIDGKDVRQFASQGQQRTVVLAVKLAELEFMREEVGEYPILLLDDVLSELDFSRRTLFLETIGNKVQTLLTTTDKGNFQPDNLRHSRQYVISDGQLALEG
ncbi:MAG: DNA replication/repair protein RecF [Firmicutes bacterium]|nr:DNA replication/repair protein RecF [Bacillota bacterium]